MVTQFDPLKAAGTKQEVQNEADPGLQVAHGGAHEEHWPPTRTADVLAHPIQVFASEHPRQELGHAAHPAPLLKVFPKHFLTQVRTPGISLDGIYPSAQVVQLLGDPTVQPKHEGLQTLHYLSN